MTAIRAPAGMDSGVIVKEFRTRFNAIIANGQGSMKGQIFRIAHLGFFDFHDLFAVIAELELILAANGHPVKFGAGVAAVQNVYRGSGVAEGSAGGLLKIAHVQRTSMKILVAEPLAPAGVELLRAQPGWDVVISNPKEYEAHLADCDALIVRSAVKVTKDVLAEGPEAACDRPRRCWRRQCRSRSRPLRPASW